MNNRNTIAALILAATAFAALPLHAQTAEAEKKPAAAEKKYISKKLGRAEIDALLANPEKLLVIDVRRPDEISKVGSFPVYLNIQAADLEKNVAFIPRDRTIVTVSNHAGRGLPAADFLLSKGFKVAGAVGSQNYEEEGGKITRIAIPVPKVATTAAATN